MPRWNSESGQGGDVLTLLAWGEVGAGRGKEAAEGGVKGTGGREGGRRVGNHSIPTPSSGVAYLREPETAVCSEKCLSH